MKDNISPSEVKSDNELLIEQQDLIDDFMGREYWQHFLQSCLNKIGYTDDFHDYWVAFRDAVFNGDIQEAHKATVEGIKWYNSQNK